MGNNDIARAGLGLSLEGGASVIQDLRTIHDLMKGIVSLAGGIPKGVGGVFTGPTRQSQNEIKSAYNSHVQQYKTMEEAKTRIAKEEARKRKQVEDAEKTSRKRGSSGAITNDEIRAEADKQRRMKSLREQGKQERLRQEAEEDRAAERRLRRIEREAARELQLQQQTFQAQDKIRRARVASRYNPLNPQLGIGKSASSSYANEYGESIRNLRAYNAEYNRLMGDAQRLRRRRNDPIAMNDPMTNAFRDETAFSIAGLRQHFQRFKEERAREVRKLAASGPIEVDQSLRIRLKSVRNDPAAQADMMTQQWRQQLAGELRAQRLQRDIHSRTAAPEGRLAYFARDRGIQDRISSQNRYDAQIAREQREQREANELYLRKVRVETRRNLRRYSEVTIPESTDPYGFRTYARRDERIRSSARASYDQQFRDMAAMRPMLSRPLDEEGNVVPMIPPRFRGPGGGGPPDGPRGPRGSGGGGSRPPLNARGFFTTADVIGRITRNILLYEVISRATYGLVNYVSQAVTAAKTTVEFSNALRFATEQAGGNIGANERLADSLQKIGLSRQQGRAAVTEAARFAENRPQDTESLTRTVADIAAARGQGVDRTDELIEQLRRRESKFYKRVFGTTVESIYEQFAANQIDTNTTTRFNNPSLFIGGGVPKSRTEEIKSFVAAMDDSQKETAVFNYVLSQSIRFQGEAEERADTLAGKLDKMAAAWLNAQEGVGLFITELKPVNNLLDGIIGRAGFLDKLRAPSYSRSTKDGTIGTADLTKYAIESTQGFRYKALSDINNYAEPLTLGALGLGLTAFMGHGQARQMMPEGVGPGFKNSLTMGLKRMTYGMSNTVTDPISAFFGVPKLSDRFVPSYSDIASQRVRASGSNLGYALQAQGPFSEYAQFKPYLAPQGPYSVIGTTAGRTGTGPNVQGPYSRLIDRPYEKLPSVPTITDKQYNRLLGIQTAAGVTGGLVGGAIGATIGSIVAEKLDVGPIAATGITISGAIVGNTIGTTVGTAIGSSIVTYIASVGGLGKLLLGGVSAVGTYATGGVGAIAATGLAGLGAIGGTVVGGLALGGAIGAGINYLNPNDAMSIEQRKNDQAEAYAKAYARREKEYSDASLEGRTLYRDLRPGSQTFNQLMSRMQAEAADPNAFAKGFDNQYRGFGREVLGRTSDELKRFNLATTTQKVAGVDSFGQQLNETVLVRRIELEAQLTGEFKNQQEVQNEIAKVRDKINNPEATDEEKKAGEARLKQLNNETYLLGQIVDLKNDEAKLRVYGTTDAKQIEFLDDYRKRQDENIAKRKEKDATKKAENLNEVENALAKLRDAVAGSFRLVGEIGQSIVGGDNEFTQILADRATASMRMQQQWGFKGQGAVDYFTNLEQKNLDRQLTKAQYSSYGAATDLRNKALQETDARSTITTLSRRDQEYLDIQTAIVNQAQQIPQLWSQAAQILNRSLSPTQMLFGQLNMVAKAFGVSGPTRQNIYGQDITPDLQRRNIYGQSLGGYFDMPTRKNIYGQSLEDPRASRAFADVGRGESPELAMAMRKNFSTAILSTFQNMSPQQIKASGLQDYYVGAIRAQAGSLGDDILQARAKADLGAREDARLSQQLKADEQFRRLEILSGRDRLTVGTESDKLLLRRTDNISPKDLTFDQFSARQEALRREAEREVHKQQEAEAAVAQGLAYQQVMTEDIAVIRAAILGGDMSMLIQVQNDTQARVDRDALKFMNEGYYKDPDQRGVKSSPYTPSTKKYLQTGGKYGLTNK